MPKPIKTPAAVGAIQWMESVNPVQPKLCNVLKPISTSRNKENKAASNGLYSPEYTCSEDWSSDNSR
jgi:hypothetical protein